MKTFFDPTAMKARILFVAALSLAAIACVREAPVEISIVPGEPVTIHACVENHSVFTKTLRNEADGSVLWAPGDKISVWFGSGSPGGSMFTSQNDENAPVADFNGEISITLADKWFWGAYPYSAANECDGNSVTMTLPSLQTATPGTFAPGSFLSVGRSKSLEMPFYNVCGGLKFRVSKAGIKRVTFRSLDGPIAGKARIAFNGSGKPEVQEIIEGSDVIVLEAPGGQTFDTGSNYYISIFPHTFSERFFSVTFETDTQIGTYTRASAFTITRSVFEGFNVAMDSTVEWADIAGRISTPAELQQFLQTDAAAAAAGAQYLIVADIDMSGIPSVASATSFAGVLDGCDHTVSGISSSQPLIQSLSGTVKNLTLGSDCVFTPAVGSTFGAIANYSSGAISRVTTKAAVGLSTDAIAVSTLVAGIVGRSSGPIENCRNEGSVSVTASAKTLAVGVAGLAGYLEAPMANCVNAGDVSYSTHYLSGSSYLESLNIKAVPSIGGLVAYGDPSGFAMTACDNRGNVLFNVSNADIGDGASRLQIGGVAGSPAGPIVNCNNYGDVSVSIKHSTPGEALPVDVLACVGGIGGGDYYFTSSVTSNTDYVNCVNEGAVTLDSDSNISYSPVAGIVGWPGKEAATPTSATGCINRGTITASGAVKCRAAGIEGGTGAMTGCTNEGLIHVISCDPASQAASLCAFHSRGQAITDCTAAGSIVCDVQINNGVGGLVGLMGNVAHNTGTGCTVNCTITVPFYNTYCLGMVVGAFNGTSASITLGSAVSEIQVSGSINGIPASSEIISGRKNRHTNHLIYTNFGKDDGTDIPEPNILPPTLTENTINGTAILGSSNVAGLIKDSSTGMGIPGVAVSDGYSVVVTDANGVYQMQRDSRSRKVYYTTPAAYKINLDPGSHLPSFYSTGIFEPSGRYRADFTLEPLDSPETEFTLFMIGDPQCYQTSEVNRYTKETVKDIKATAASYPNVYCVTLGDITFDSTGLWDEMVMSMSNVQQAGSRYIPFFQTIGNHDHNSLESDTGDDADDDYRAVRKYVEKFGPTDYSFDRGNAHIIVMDDIMVKSLKSSGKPNGYTWQYDGGFTADQYAWIQQDLANVADKGNKLGMLCLHIPFRGGSYSGGGANVNRYDAYYDEFLELMRDFKEFHIMIGHTHYQQNYLHTSKTCQDGSYIYEHVHGAACGAWWAADCNLMGSPNGYTIYTVNGNNVTNWKMKGANHPENYQLRVYDGNQYYSGSYLNTHWYEERYDVRSVADMNVIGFPEAQNSFVVEVFNDDKANWTVEFWQDGVKKGNFVRRADSGYHNVAVCSYWINNAGKRTTSWTKSTCSHYWYYTPASGDPSSESNWEVRAYQTIPNHPSQVNVYTCNKLTTDYSCFEKP